MPERRVYLSKPMTNFRSLLVLALLGNAAEEAIAAGERWKDGSLRPTVEDLWGAGGFLAALDVDGFSPEARAAAAAYKDAADELPNLLYDCAGGREASSP